MCQTVTGPLMSSRVVASGMDQTNELLAPRRRPQDAALTSIGMKLSSIFCRWAPLRKVIFDRVAGDMNGETTRHRPVPVVHTACARGPRMKLLPGNLRDVQCEPRLAPASPACLGADGATHPRRSTAH